MSGIRHYMNIVNGSAQSQLITESSEVLEEGAMKNAALGMAAFGLLMLGIGLGSSGSSDDAASNPAVASSTQATPDTGEYESQIIQQCYEAEQEASENMVEFVNNGMSGVREVPAGFHQSLKRAISTCRPVLNAFDPTMLEGLPERKKQAVLHCHKALKYKVAVYQDALNGGGPGADQNLEGLFKYAAKCNAEAENLN